MGRSGESVVWCGQLNWMCGVRRRSIILLGPGMAQLTESAAIVGTKKIGGVTVSDEVGGHCMPPICDATYGELVT